MCDGRSKSVEGCTPDRLFFVGEVAPESLDDVVIARGQEGANTTPSAHSLPYRKSQSHP